MTLLIIGILAVAWIAFLAPTILKARNNQGRSDSVGDFKHRLRALGGTHGDHHRPPRAVHTRSQPALFGPVTAGPGAMSPAQKRRRDVLLILAGAVALTLIAAVVTRSPLFILLQLLADAALVGYVYLLLQYKQRASVSTSRGMRAIPGTPTTASYVAYPTLSARPSYSLGTIDLRDDERNGPRLVALRSTASG
ncbi:MAG: hypothetical protein ABW073_01890 [Acidimicrobiia bacterium]